MASYEYIVTSIVSGGVGGLAFDLILHPVETVKTRLQSNSGFWKTGGFHGIYRGIGSALLGSIPYASTFFVAYDVSKVVLPRFISNDASVHLIGACIGETFASVAHMPFEVVKTTAQAAGNFTTRAAFKHVLRDGVSGLYSGLFSRVCREVPYVAIQFPIWEYLKSRAVVYNDRDATYLESGIYGSISAAISATITTPLDVAKTRIVLSNKSCPNYTENPFLMINRVYKHEGIHKLFSGVVPRVIWLSVGGFLYLGAYDLTKTVVFKNYLFSKNC